MQYVYTVARSTEMVERQTVRNWPINLFEDPSVSRNGAASSSSRSELSVTASSKASYPKDTPVWLEADILGKSIHRALVVFHINKRIIGELAFASSEGG